MKSCIVYKHIKAERSDGVTHLLMDTDGLHPRQRLKVKGRKTVTALHGSDRRNDVLLFKAGTQNGHIILAPN